MANKSKKTPGEKVGGKIKLTVRKREVLGRKVKKLRAEGVLPANVYGRKFNSVAVELPLEDFFQVYRQVGATGVVYLSGLSQGEVPVLIRNLQYHPVGDRLLHAEFYAVDLTKKTEVEVPVEIVGEAPAVKEEGGVLVQNLSHIQVEALPNDIPEKFEVDVSQLVKIDDGVLVKDLKIDKNKVKILTGEEEVVVKVEPQAEEEEGIVVEPAEVEVGADGEAKEESDQEGGKAEKKEEGEKEPAGEKKTDGGEKKEE